MTEREAPRLPTGPTTAVSSRYETARVHADVLRWQQVGDKRARDRALASLTGMIWDVARKFKRHDWETDDFAQELWIGATMAADRWDPSKPAIFTTYARHAAVGHLMHTLRNADAIRIASYIREKHSKAHNAGLPAPDRVIPRAFSLSSCPKLPGSERTGGGGGGSANCGGEGDLDGLAASYGVHTPDFSADADLKIDMERMIDAIKFTPAEREALLRHLSDETTVDAARRLGINWCAENQRRKTARRKLAKRFNARALEAARQ